MSLVVFIPQERLRDSLGPHSWLVTRTLLDIVALQKRLQPYFSWVASLDLPPVNKTIFGKLTEKTENVETAKVLIQRFMDALLRDELVSGSELVYNFFSPSPEHLKCIPPAEETKLKKLTSIFINNDQSKKDKDDIRNEESTLMEEFYDKSPCDVKEDIAEPFFGLISEIFDLKGVFKWFRKSLMTFVQLSFGGTISRQLQDTATYMVSEAMVVTYLNIFKNSMWSQGQLRPVAAPRSQAEREQAKEEARRMFMREAPRIMVKVVGPQTSAQGMEKIFESVQNKTLNKHLVYRVLEAVVRELIPELQDTRAAMQLNQFT